LDELPERARTAYAMARAKRPQREIAEELGVGVRTVQADLRLVREAMMHQNGVHS
jgi:DNA-directed RNA polymerase specialized sigma24 family protein